MPVAVSPQQLDAFIARYETPEAAPIATVTPLGDDAGSYDIEKLAEVLQLWADANPEFQFERGTTSKGPGFHVRCPGDMDDGWPDGMRHTDRATKLTSSASVWIGNGHPRFRCGHSHCGEGSEKGKKTWKHLQQRLDPDGSMQHRVLAGAVLSTLSEPIDNLSNHKVDNVVDGGYLISETEEGDVTYASLLESNTPKSDVRITFPTDGETSETNETCYPVEIWAGTDYAEFAERCSEGNFIPKEFLIEAIKTVTGAVVGSALSIPEIEGGVPRFYTVLMGGAGSGKGTSISWASSIFKDVSLGGTAMTQLLWSPTTEIQDVPWSQIGACEEGFNSAPGMQRSNVNGQKRWLQTFEELDHMIEGSGIDGSGKALMGVNRQLYDREEFVTTTTGKRDAIAGKAQNTILAATTQELWTDMFAGKSVRGSGLFQRFNLMASENTRKVGTLRKPKLELFKSRFTAGIIAMDKAPVEMSVSNDAVAAIDEWFIQPKFEDADGEVRGRLNVLAWRNALHLAWQRGQTSVDLRAVEDAIKLSDYQFEIRRRYTPAEGESQGALVENKIRNFIRVVLRVHRRELIRKLNLTRYGAYVIDRALATLRGTGEIQLLEETTPAGRKSLIIQWLGLA